MKKKLFGVLLALGLLALLSTVAFAAEDYTMDFSQDATVSWGSEVSTVNFSTADASGTGWSWTYQNNTLTLSGLNFTTTAAIAVKLPAGSIIVVEANTTNTVTSTFSGIEDSNGIRCEGALTIRGSGTLSATGGTATNERPNTPDSVGVCARAAITISDNVVLRAIGGHVAKDGFSCGIQSETSDITISGNANVTATGGDATVFPSKSYGICGADVKITGGTIEANGGDADESCGICNGGDLEISGTADVTATGGPVTVGSGTSGGIGAENNERGNVILSGGTIEAIGGTLTTSNPDVTGGYCYGIRAGRNVEISGSADVTAKGGDTAVSYVSSEGISAYETITISGGSVDVTGGDLTGIFGYSAGIFGRTVVLSGGTIEGTGGTANQGFGSNSYGIAFATATVSGSADVTATGGAADADSMGMCGEGGVTIAGGSVDATGGAADKSYGIYTDPTLGNFVISGGTVTANAGTANLRSATSKQPVMTDYTGGYKWRTDSGAFILSTATAYQWAAAHTYLEIQPVTPPPPPPPIPQPRSGGGSDDGSDTYYSRDERVKIKTLDPSGDVTTTALDKDSADYTLLLRGQSGEPVMAYEIDGERDGEAIVTFYVGRENACKEYTVLHKLADGSIEEFHVTCAVNGWITVRVKEFSPFMVFAGSVGGGTVVTTTAYVENPDTGANDAVALATALGTLALIGCCVVGKRRK